jgi:hypothetical protein
MFLETTMNLEDHSKIITQKAKQIIADAIRQFALNLEAKMIERRKKEAAYQKLHELEQEISQASKEQPEYSLENI